MAAAIKDMKLKVNVRLSHAYSYRLLMWALRKVATQQLQIAHYQAREYLWRKLGALGR